jgi:hypothetical protein
VVFGESLSSAAGGGMHIDNLMVWSETPLQEVIFRLRCFDASLSHVGV